MASFAETYRKSEKTKNRDASYQHNLLECSACGSPLLDVQVTNPEIEFTARYRADCPHCGDHSLAREITGGVSIIATDHVIMTSFEPLDDIIYLRTIKSEKKVAT